MHEFDFLGELVLIGAMAVAIILVFQRLKIPPVIGLIFTGILLGPSGIGVVYDEKLISTLAELGVVLLLFTIGLEFSLDDLKRLRRIVLVGGVVQIVFTGLAISFLAYWLMLAIGREISTSAAIFLGFAFSVSSTAICLKILSDRDELELPHGRIALGILIFQDLAIVPLIIGISFLNPEAVPSLETVLRKIGFIVLFASGIFLGFRIFMPKMVRIIASLHAREVLVIGALVICFGAAYLTSLAGLSLALGSFVAGMVIASTDESHQISVTIDPFREAFTSIFFISVGLLLDVQMINLPLFAAMALGVLLVKGLLVTIVSVFLGNSIRVSLMAGMALAQIGEFSFVLADSGLANGVINQEVFQAMLAIIVVTMIVTPAMIALAPRIADQVAPALGFIPLVSRDAPLSTVRPADSTIICAGEIHAAIVGFGVNGQNVAAVLHATNISYSVLEIDRELVRTMRRKGEPIYYGDCTEQKSLLRAGIDHARAVVLGISDMTAVRRSIGMIRQINPKAFIIVRSRTLHRIDELYAAGADVVVTEKFETSIQIFSQLLNHFTVDPELILQQQEIIRRECEKIFRHSPGMLK
ncbi:cation:proton antiporter [Pelodictyon luteolum]|uniref:Kef-type potassium/proton antiporter, CPA2 family n=1 Tax=Chlorobium luteolum (strain DSM 273 / BCRC 81028 / 2530) TaxID=319225 RepID=Q3B535_CHLL3|nr:cation:proton antiporter [Pelodictyon luteolum]ABB23546.1 Kef-type potassium/proton antiporter, CPA2 family [Pelodictyon luteolum DSM 273]